MQNAATVPDRARMCSISTARSIGFIGTSTRRAIAVANDSRYDSGVLAAKYGNSVTRREARRESASHGFRLGNRLRVGPPNACRRFCGTRHDGGAVRSSRRGVPQDAGDRRVEDRLARIGRPP
jgi:hypothetical protein